MPAILRTSPINHQEPVGDRSVYFSTSRVRLTHSRIPSLQVRSTRSNDFIDRKPWKGRNGIPQLGSWGERRTTFERWVQKWETRWTSNLPIVRLFLPPNPSWKCNQKDQGTSSLSSLGPFTLSKLRILPLLCWESSSAPSMRRSSTPGLDRLIVQLGYLVAAGN